MRYNIESSPLEYSDTNIEPINIICQYFISADPKRQKEIDYCLQKNIDNPLITKIYLLNEKIYNLPESLKIVQINVEKRLTFKMVFDFIEQHNITGYNVISNSDIFFDDTLMRLYQSNIHKTNAAFALLRYEYCLEKEPVLYGPCTDSQDTWILHSSANIMKKYRDAFDFNFGMIQCDNKLIYLLHILGYKIYNTPLLIKTFHYHTSGIRTYSSSTRIPNPGMLIDPGNSNCRYSNIPHDIRIRNTQLYDYIKSKDKPFIIPRIGMNKPFVEIARIGQQLLNCKVFDAKQNQLFATLKHNCKMANLSLDDKQLAKYIADTSSAFSSADMFIKWPEICVPSGINQDLHIQNGIWSFALEIFHFINIELPWTHALTGKRILIISEFADLINEQIPKSLYKTAKFPIFPPSCSIRATNTFNEKLQDFDVALCAMGEYSNQICAQVLACGKSAINVGNVLLMYFGIVPGRFNNIHRDIISLYADDQWKLLPGENVANDCILHY